MQARVQEAVDRLVADGAELGVQVAVFRHGEQVVDAVAGVADPATGRPVTPDTPFHCYSVGKGVTATVAHVLAERGAFGYDTRIVELWPEFGANGKQSATVRHALTHAVGIPGLPADVTPEDLCDWPRMCALVADATPWWEPGARTGYHAYTFGWVVGEMVRRATGGPISQVLREEVAGPLGVADELWFGVPEADLPRLARLEDADGAAEALAAIPDGSPMLRTGPRALWPTAAFGNRRDILMADIPAGGRMTARAVARMYAALLGEVDGVRLVPPARLHAISAVAVDDVDQVMGNRAVWALGYGVGRPGASPDATPTTFGMAGAGGTWAYADTATGTAFALAKNRLTADFDTVAKIAAIVADEVGGPPSPPPAPHPGRRP